MGCGFEKLHYFVKSVLRQDLNQGNLYLFFDGTGLVQISKRIERGRFMSRLELCEIAVLMMKIENPSSDQWEKVDGLFDAYLMLTGMNQI